MHVVSAALLAGLVAIAVTVAIERLGGRRGGLLGTLPTTIVPAALGFWWASPTITDFQDALWVVPAGMMLNATFLLFWREVPRRLPAWSLLARLSAMVALSMGAWLVLAIVLLLATESYRDTGLPMLAFGWGFFLLAVLLGLLACLRSVAAPAGARRVGPATLLSRGALAAGAVGLAVAMVTVLGPLAAGIVSIFPAIFLTTIVALWWSQGEAVPAGAIGPMMLGSTSVSAFALLAASIMPLAGPLLGAIAAWLGAAMLVTLPAWWLLVRVARAASPGRLGGARGVSASME